MKTLYDVIARIPGSDKADEWVVRGNHHDAWVEGAGDPLSGQVALLEEARAYGALLAKGWKPRRTIIYCAWDGEEPALLGSTEWVETHEAELKQHAVAYFNTDGNGRGYLGVGGSHILEAFLNGVARDITDPETNILSVAADASAPHPYRYPARARRSTDAGQPAHRGAGIGVGLLTFSPACRSPVRESRIRRRRPKWYLPLGV